MLYRSLIEALYTLNSPPVVSFYLGFRGAQAEEQRFGAVESGELDPALEDDSCCRLVRGPGASGLGFRAQGSGFRVQSLGFRVQGLGFRV